tara:strand:- start:358 stop:801 length:444 start_codon:yes stop_codon:yes gene_type:complete
MTTESKQEVTAPTVTFLGMMHEGVPCRTEDLEACVRFYTEVLGLKLLPRPKALDKLGPGAWLSDPNDRVQFHLIANDTDFSPGPDAAVSPAGRHTAWVVEDIDSFCDRMDALNVSWESIDSLIGARQVFVTDPAGHTWEFQGPPTSK